MTGAEGKGQPAAQQVANGQASTQLSTEARQTPPGQAASSAQSGETGKPETDIGARQARPTSKQGAPDTVAQSPGQKASGQADASVMDAQAERSADAPASRATVAAESGEAETTGAPVRSDVMNNASSTGQANRADRASEAIAAARAGQAQSDVPVSENQVKPGSEGMAGQVDPARAGAEGDAVARVAAQDAVQARTAQLSGQDTSAPTQLKSPQGAVAANAGADAATARQAQQAPQPNVDGNNLRAGESAVRNETAAINGATGGGSTSGEGSDSNSGQSRQDANGQTAAQQSAQPRATQSGQNFAQQMPAAMQLMTPRWGQAVGERMIMMAQHGPRSAQIQLDPPELGAMQIRVHVQGQDQVSVSFTSPNPAVRDALEQQMPRLREMLAEQGLDLHEGSISDDASSGQGSDQRGGSEGRSGGYAGGGSDSQSEPLPGQAVAVGLVDYYA